MSNFISFNKPFLTGKEAHYMCQAVYSMKLSGNGMFTKRSQQFFEEKYGFKKAICTTSGTDALEMAAILCDVKPICYKHLYKHRLNKKRTEHIDAFMKNNN